MKKTKLTHSKITQLLSVTPDELKESIVSGVISKLDQVTAKFTPSKPEEYLTRKEAAQLFKVTVKTISVWCKNGTLKPYRIGKFIRFKRSELDEALIKIQNNFL